MTLDSVLRDPASGRDVDDDDDGREETKEENGGREDTAGRKASDEGGDGDRADALEGLVETLKDGQVGEPVFRLKEVSSEQGDGTSERLLLTVVGHMLDAVLIVRVRRRRK